MMRIVSVFLLLVVTVVGSVAAQEQNNTSTITATATATATSNSAATGTAGISIGTSTGASTSTSTSTPVSTSSSSTSTPAVEQSRFKQVIIEDNIEIPKAVADPKADWITVPIIEHSLEDEKKKLKKEDNIIFLDLDLQADATNQYEIDQYNAFLQQQQSAFAELSAQYGGNGYRNAQGMRGSFQFPYDYSYINRAYLPYQAQYEKVQYAPDYHQSQHPVGPRMASPTNFKRDPKFTKYSTPVTLPTPSPAAIQAFMQKHARRYAPQAPVMNLAPRRRLFPTTLPPVYNQFVPPAGFKFPDRSKKFPTVTPIKSQPTVPAAAAGAKPATPAAAPAAAAPAQPRITFKQR